MKNINIVIVILTLLIASYFVFFLHLTSHSLHMWDEARNAVHAVEMLNGGNFLVKTYDGVPDIHSDAKTPFFIWTVALSMKIFGMNELGLRFPSALFALLSALFLFIFSVKYLKSMQTGAIGWLVLITSLGFIGEHVARTGDYDAMLALWITCYSLFYFLFLNCPEEKKQKKYFLLFTIFLIFSVLAKGIAGLMFLPGLALYTLLHKKIIFVLKNHIVYIGIIVFLMVIAGFYFLLEKITPGYLQQVYVREISSFNSVVDGHEHPFNFYFMNFIQASNTDGFGRFPRYLPWIVFFPFCAYFSIRSKQQIVSQLGIFCTISVLAYFFIISSSSTKLIWYDAPLYPMAALLAAIGLNEIFCATLKNTSTISIPARIFLIVVIFFLPYLNVFSVIYKPQETLWWERTRYGQFFRKILPQDLSGLKNFTVIDVGYNAHLTFYVKAFNMKGYKIKYERDPNYEIANEETILTCVNELSDAVKSKYKTEILFGDNNCIVCKVKEKIHSDY